MNKKIIIILRSEFYQYLSQKMTNNVRKTEHKEIENLLKRQDRYDNKERRYMYLFGNRSYPGVFQDYINRGYELVVYEEGLWRSVMLGAMAFNNKSQECFADTYYDFQLSSSVPYIVIKYLLEKNNVVTGWAPASFANKGFQALLVNKILKKNIPRQIICFQASLGLLTKISKEQIDSWFDSEYLILKDCCSVHSKMTDGTGYIVFRKENWKKFIEIASRNNWYGTTSGVIISEFVQTKDPYSSNMNGVVHKVHLPSGENNFSFLCNKVNAKIDLQKISNNVMPMNELLQNSFLGYGNLVDYKKMLKIIMKKILPFPCLFGIDIMLPESGKLNIIEFNKNAGTFLEPTSVENINPLAEYIEYILTKDWSPLLMKEQYKNFCDEFKEINLFNGLFWL